MKKIELKKEEKIEIINELYKSFENGYEFEEFLKPLLEILGIDEVHVTKRSQDGGVDLEGIRYGVINNNNDSVLYRVQAKRYKPKSIIGVDIVDRHLGIMNNGEKGIIITTGKFSQPAREAAIRKPETPIVLIDGEDLVNICIEKNIGFVYKPIFSNVELNEFYKKELREIIPTVNTNYIISNIEKTITANDIRCKILSIPRAILDALPKDKKLFNIVFNGNKINSIKISSDRRYFARSMAEMYRKYGLLTKDNVFNSTKSIWSYDGEIIEIELIK